MYTSLVEIFQFLLYTHFVVYIQTKCKGLFSDKNCVVFLKSTDHVRICVSIAPILILFLKRPLIHVVTDLQNISNIFCRKIDTSQVYNEVQV